MAESVNFHNYIVYSNGKIWSNYKHDYLVPQDNGIGYMKVLIRVDGKPKNMYVHRLVAECFLANPLSLKEVNHIDGNKKNNDVSNLEWCTDMENKTHAVNTGLTLKGEKNHAHKLTEEQIKLIRSEYVFGSKDRGQRSLAKKYNVSQTAIRYILTGRNWRYCFEY